MTSPRLSLTSPERSFPPGLDEERGALVPGEASRSISEPLQVVRGMPAGGADGGGGCGRIVGREGRHARARDLGQCAGVRDRERYTGALGFEDSDLSQGGMLEG